MTLRGSIFYFQPLWRDQIIVIGGVLCFIFIRIVNCCVGIAQLVTAKNTDNVKECHHFNAPGIGRSQCQKFKENTKNQKVIPEIYSYKHAGDIIHHGGGAHLPANKHIVVGQLEFNPNFVESAKMAHTKMLLLSEYGDNVKTNEKTPLHFFATTAAEGGRLLAGTIGIPSVFIAAVGQKNRNDTFREKCNRVEALTAGYFQVTQNGITLNGQPLSS